MIILPIPDALHLDSSPVLAKFTRTLRALPNAKSSHELWEYAANIAGAELDWPNKRLMFDDDAYLLFVLKWS